MSNHKLHGNPRLVTGVRTQEAGTQQYYSLAAYEGWTDVCLTCEARDFRLTPAEARFFATQLRRVAKRVEDNNR